MKENSLVILASHDELLRNGDQNYRFRQSSDFLYLTGISQARSILVICPWHPEEKFREVIFTLAANETAETWNGHRLSNDEVTDISGIATVFPLEEFSLVFRNMVLTAGLIYLNFNEYFKYTTEVAYRDRRLADQVRSMFPAHGYDRLAPLMASLRAVKEPEEVELIRQACRITESAFRRVLGFLTPGVKEYEVEAEITHEFIRRGAREHAYLPIIAAGGNALVLHYTDNRAECRDGELLLMDFGAEHLSYAADITRTIPVNGNFTKRQRQCYDAVLNIQKEAIRLMVPGNTIGEINRAVIGLTEKAIVDLGLTRMEEIRKQDAEHPVVQKYLMHGISHFLGLDVHDTGDRFARLERGMVLTCEPALYIREEQMGIRIENDILVDDPPVDLTASVPREAEEIEGLMNKSN
ncbi:MAG: aminopeptidase P N-terminal domain-containing protein [Bacteroidales bacterium]|nr:aminopeptidase P N-terminal domain-containing protein [Bacteroidales bacterium]